MTRSRDDAVTAPAGPLPAGLLPDGLARPASVGVLVVVAAYVHVFFSLTDVVGGTARVALAMGAAAVAGIVLARVIDERTAAVLTAVLLVVGLAGYYFAVPESQRALFSIRAVAVDTLSLLTGLSVLRLTLTDVWVLAVAPVPTFLVAYLTGRGRHVPAAGVAGGTLGFLVLTGDATGVATLVGVGGVALAAGLTTLSVPGGLRSRGDTLAVLLALMVVASATVTLIPAGAAQPWGGDRGTPGLESTLDGDDELEIVGSTRLSPEVRFTMQSDRAANWHTGSYDTYTGDGWVRSGEPDPLDGPLAGPPGETVAVESSFTAETVMGTIPAPWQAVDVAGPVAGSAQVDDRGTIRPGTPVLAGDRVTVESQVLDADPDDLRAAGDEYDDRIVDRYTQLPESTPDRVGDRTAEILAEADADTPYDRAVAIERYLIEEYDYSLSVARPDGDVADGFLFEMDAGYCTYFATTMVVMLRSQGIPARFVTGYSSGEQVSDDEWVVRGQDAHAWVTVYVPEHGWVEFDPTPSAERDQVRLARLAEARASGAEDVDTAQSVPEQGATVDEEPAPGVPVDDDAPVDGAASDANATDGNVTDGVADPMDGLEGPEPDELGDEADVGGVAEAGGTGPGGWLPVPSRETLGYALFLVVVAIAGAHHTGATTRAHRAIGVRLPARRRDPATDVQRAFADLEYLLSDRYRPRRPGETPRSYLAALRLRGVDERVHGIGEAYERAMYAGAVTREDADEARATVRRLALEATPVIGGLLART